MVDCRKVKLILFDLDGTLIDTAPDMGGALNNLLIEEKYQPLPLEQIRPFVSQGGLVLTRLGFASKVAEAEIEPLRLRFLDHYRTIVADNSRLFDGMATILEQIETRAIPWGIVTNKPERYTLEILRRKPINPAPQTIICPDHVRHTKPDPEPILLACAELGVAPENCVYVGDHLRDIEAGLRAGCTTIAALYGYLSETDKPEDWGAHHQVNNAAQITNILFPQA